MAHKDLETLGFLCDYDEETLKLFTLELTMIEQPNTLKEEPKLGQWYQTLGLEEVEEEERFESDQIKVWCQNGVVMVKVLAVGPHMASLPNDIRKKFSYAVWSPYLKFLRDPTRKFHSAINGGDVGLVTVKYAPCEKYNFEVMDVGVPEAPNSGYWQQTPWDLEYIASNMDTLAAPKPHQLSVNQLGYTNNYDTQVGVCIATNVYNGSHSYTNKGSSTTCRILFSSAWGLTRWAKQEKEETKNKSWNPSDPSIEDENFGKWFSYSLYDTRRKQKVPAQNRTKAFLTCTAKKLNSIPPVLPTKVIDNTLLFETSFKFEHNKLEKLPVEDYQNWENRFNNLSTEAFFMDFLLGKVEIYPHASKQIIQKIEDHKSSLEPKEFERLKDETIIVVVDVAVLGKYLENFKKDPKNGIFYINDIIKIIYLNGGDYLYKK